MYTYQEKPGGHFHYEEWLVSKDYPDLADQMELTEADKLKIYYQTLTLENVRSNCNNLPTRILSGKRIPELNSSVGGAEDSDHLYTDEKCATDFCFFYDNEYLWNAFCKLPQIAPMGFGQIIIYLYTEDLLTPRFIHYSLPTNKHQGEKLITIDGIYYSIETAVKEYDKIKKYIPHSWYAKI